MRLIAHVSSEKHASCFSDFLSSHNISNQYEKVDSCEYALWVHQEEDVTRALDYFQQFILNTEDPRFLVKKHEEKTKVVVQKKSIFSFSLTFWILILCGVLFVWNGRQEDSLQTSSREDVFISEFTLTSLQKTLFFDDPKAMEAIQDFVEEHSISSLETVKKESSEVQKAFARVIKLPFWQGVFHLALEKIQKGTIGKIPPMFEKIQEGEVWRVVSPTFMHRDFLHIFFNMAWFLTLGKQIEVRLKKTRMIFLILLLAAFSNTAQYLMSGPYFLGFSGVITGLAAFIWVRQKKAPWEGYPLQRSTALFLFYFVLILFFVSIVCFILQAFGGTDFASSIANTAHMAGGLLGFVLGRCSFFARRVT